MEKEILEVNQNASKSLSKVKKVFQVLAVLGVVLGVILFIAGIAQYEDGAVAAGVGFVISAIITYLFTLPVIRGFIVIVKTAEYHNAKVESKYDIN